MVDRKRVDETPHPARVTRLGRDGVELVTGAALSPAHVDLKLLMDLEPGQPATESYVRVAARQPREGAGPPGTRISAVFTSLAETRPRALERVVDARIARVDAG